MNTNLTIAGNSINGRVDEMSPAFSPKQRMFLGKIIKRYRNLKDLSQKDLGDKAKIDPGYLSKIERGEVAISINTLAKIAEVLGVRLWQLLKEAEEELAKEGDK